MNDAQQAAPRFQVWSCVGPFGCLLLWLPTLNVCVSKLSSCTIPRLGIICAINSKFDRNSIGCNSAFAKIPLPTWLPARISSSRPLCRPRFLLPFFGYLLAHGLAWNSDPEQMHRHIRAFLRNEVVCQISRDTTLDGYMVELTGNSPVLQSSLRVLLAAIRDFYAVMAEAGLYPFSNPMCSPLLQRWKRERGSAPLCGGCTEDPLAQSH